MRDCIISEKRCRVADTVHATNSIPTVARIDDALKRGATTHGVPLLGQQQTLLMPPILDEVPTAAESDGAAVGPADSSASWGSFWRPAPLALSQPAASERGPPSRPESTFVPLLDRVQAKKHSLEQLRRACPACQEGGRGQLCDPHRTEQRLEAACPVCEVGGRGPTCHPHQEEERLSRTCPGCDPHGRGAFCYPHDPSPKLLAATLTQNVAEIRRALERKGVDPNVTDEDGVSALYRVAGDGLSGAVGLLLQAGASVNQVTAYGESALMRAAASGHAEVCELLLQGGADPTLQSNIGYDARRYSQGTPCEKLIGEAFANFGAQEEATDRGLRRSHSQIVRDRRRPVRTVSEMGRSE